VEADLDEHALRRVLRAGRDLVSDLDLDSLLGRVLETAIEVTGARYAALGVLNEDRSGLANFIHRGVDEDTRRRIGDLPTGRGVLGALIDDPTPLRLADVSAHPRSYGFPDGHPPMHGFLGVPIAIHGEPWGNLYLTEKAGGVPFGEADQAATVVLAEWAAIAIGNARSVAAERLRLTMDAAEQERLQWARELHDETLQGLAAVRLILASGRREGAAGLEVATDRALEQIDAEIAGMRALISDLRPDSLDKLGVAAALEGLARRLEVRSEGVRIEVEADHTLQGRFDQAVEIAVYRVAQEAVTNAIRHGVAKRIRIVLAPRDGEVELRVVDEGSGFDPERVDLGFGIAGMQERAELAGGAILIQSTPGRGAAVRMRLPIEGRRRDSG
jgi:signal transduction histidine kinase